MEKMLLKRVDIPNAADIDVALKHGALGIGIALLDLLDGLHDRVAEHDLVAGRPAETRILVLVAHTVPYLFVLPNT